jgi:hypothetical protein
MEDWVNNAGLPTPLKALGGARATDEPGSDFPVRPDGDEEMAESGETTVKTC